MKYTLQHQKNGVGIKYLTNLFWKMDSLNQNMILPIYERQLGISLLIFVVIYSLVGENEEIVENLKVEFNTKIWIKWKFS